MVELPRNPMVRAVPRVAAAVLTRLLLSKTVAKSRSGRWSSRDTNLALWWPIFTRCSRHYLGKAMKAVSEGKEKKAA